MATRQSTRSRTRGSQSETPATDDTLPQKKRARHRFVGALALCVLAAAVVPWFLDPEPSRTSSELDLLMPSRHMPGPAGQAAKEAVSQEIGVLESGGTAKAVAALDGEGDAGPVPEVAESVATAPDLVTQPATPKQDEPRADAAAAGASSPASVVPQEPSRAEGAVQPAQDRAQAGLASERGANKPAARARAPESMRGRHAVQVGAYATDAAAATALQRVHSMGLRAFTERIKTERGERIRVRVGPYASREAAEMARTKLKAAGIEAAIIAP